MIDEVAAKILEESEEYFLLAWDPEAEVWRTVWQTSDETKDKFIEFFQEMAKTP